MSNEGTSPLRRLACVVACVGYADKLARTLRHNAELLDQMIVVTHPADHATLRACSEMEGAIETVTSERCYDDGAAFNKGKLINDGLARLDRPDWIVLTDADIFLNPNLKSSLAGRALNSNSLYYTSRYDVQAEDWAPDFFSPDHMARVARTAGIHKEPNGYFQLWNHRAPPIRHRWPAVMSEAFCSAGGIDSWFMQQFPQNTRIYLPDLAVAHLAHGNHAGNWNGVDTKRPCWKQLGVFTSHSGLYVFFKPPDGRIRIRLTDTFYGDQADVELESIARGPLPPGILAPNGRGGLVFKGRDVGLHHIHVAYYDACAD